MVVFSPGLKQLASVKHERVSGQSKKILWIFSGTRPTQSQIEALIAADGSISSNALKALGTLRLSAAYAATVIAQNISQALKKWPLESEAVEFTIHSPGPADWFVFMYVQPTINNPTYTTNASVYQAFIGTAGDVGSGSEIELLTGIVESDKIYRTNDIEIRI